MIILNLKNENKKLNDILINPNSELNKNIKATGNII